MDTSGHHHTHGHVKELAMMDFHGTSLIGGAFVPNGAGRAYHAISPVTGEPLPGTFVDATSEDIDAAMQAAHQAAGELRRFSGARIGDLLDAIAEELDAHAEALVTRANEESHLGAARLEGELARTTGQLRLLADAARNDTERLRRTDHVGGSTLRLLDVPIGPVAVFGSSNFPLAFSVPGGDTASALAAGCPVIVKAHPAHPGTSELAARAIHRACERLAFPAGTFQMIHGVDHATGAALVRHPHLRAVAFTGSHRGGTAVARLANERPHPIPVYAELGAANPVVLLSHALASRSEAMADALAESLTLGVGQFCTNPGLMLMRRGPHAEAFERALVQRLAAAPEAVMLTEGIRTAYLAGIERLTQTAGVVSCHQADALDALVGPSLMKIRAADALDEPSVFTEVFGPAGVLVLADDEVELVEVIQSLPGALVGSLFADEADSREAVEVIQALSDRVGRIVVNHVPTGVLVSAAQHHGGPYPATLHDRETSVGTRAITRFLRPLALQDVPEAWFT